MIAGVLLVAGRIGSETFEGNDEGKGAGYNVTSVEVPVGAGEVGKSASQIALQV